MWQLGLLALMVLLDKNRAAHCGLLFDESRWTMSQEELAPYYDTFDRIRRNVFAPVVEPCPVPQATLTMWRTAWARAHELPWPLNRCIFSLLDPDPAGRLTAPALTHLLSACRLPGEHADAFKRSIESMPVSAAEYFGRQSLAWSLLESAQSLSTANEVARIVAIDAEVFTMKAIEHVRQHDFSNTRFDPTGHPTVMTWVRQAIELTMSEQLRTLLEYCGGPDSKLRGQGLLGFAVAKSNGDAVSLLLEHGIDDGIDTALAAAVSMGDPAVVVPLFMASPESLFVVTTQKDTLWERLLGGAHAAAAFAVATCGTPVPKQHVVAARGALDKHRINMGDASFCY